jgi:YidC/Oxa1 family membrane protein insertase
MDKGSLLRWLLLGAAIYLFMTYGWPLLNGGQQPGAQSSRQPLAGLRDDATPKERTDEVTCDLEGPRFKVQATSKGAALKHAWMGGEKYKIEKDGKTKPIDLVTTWKQSRLPLRTDLRDLSGSADQVAYNDLDWKLESGTKKECTFVYEDESVSLRKVIAVTSRPFELSVETTVANKSDDKKKHRFTIELDEWRTDEETSGNLGRLAEWATTSEAYTNEVVRYDTTDFEADEFDDPEFTGEKWRRPEGEATWAAVSSSFFSKALFHVDAPSKPNAEMLMEEVWKASEYPDKKKDPNYGYVYRARLNYGVRELGKDASATYKVLAYLGPKEREALAGMGGKSEYQAIELLDLGYFGFIGQYLIKYLYLLFGFVGSWGVAIGIMTITVKVLLFPLSIAQIKSTMGMRKLKPQMDELNEKYKDDATQRGLATQELWRKNGVTNPMLGCLPVMLQMPVWFALYQSLQTAVELYHTSFLWFPDLSAPDAYYTIPVILGLSSVIQQRIMPMQGDAMQQKLMRWMMPAMFTVFMLFLPAGLGIYFLTNTWLSIGQQLGVERYYKSQAKPDEQDESDAESDDEPKQLEETKTKAKSKSKKKTARAADKDAKIDAA